MNIRIAGIDMSAAFVTIDKKELKSIIDEDEFTIIIRFLLSNTQMNTKINGTSNTCPFISNARTLGLPERTALVLHFLLHTNKNPTNPSYIVPSPVYT